MRKFSNDVELEICELYKNGMTIDFLRRKYGCRHEVIVSVLDSYEIKRRIRRVNKELKEDYFKVIDNENKAYFLGLLFADGNISPDKNGKRQTMVRIGLKQSDYLLLEKLREELNIHSKLSYDKRKGKESAILYVRSNALAEDLSQYGIVPNKTYVTKHLPQIPLEFEKDFLRGLLDGDGSIYQNKKSKYWHIDFCAGCYSLCDEFRNRCDKLLNIKNTNKISCRGNTYHITYHSQAIVKQLVTVLYRDSKISLARKFSLAEEIFRG